MAAQTMFKDTSMWQYTLNCRESVSMVPNKQDLEQSEMLFSQHSRLAEEQDTY